MVDGGKVGSSDGHDRLLRAAPRFDTYPQLPSTKAPLAPVGGPGPGQGVEVNKIASEVVPHSIAVEFQYSWTRMTRNFPSNSPSQNALERTKW